MVWMREKLRIGKALMAAAQSMSMISKAAHRKAGRLIAIRSDPEFSYFFDLG